MHVGVPRPGVALDRLRSPALAARGQGLLWLGGLVATCVVGTAVLLGGGRVPLFLFAPVVVAAGVLLTLRRLLAVYAVTVAWALVLITALPLPMSVLLICLGSLLAVMALMVLLARSRARVGTVWVHGESMLVDLRDRIAGNGALPPLPPGWSTQVSVRSAHGDAFSGDFLVSSLSVDRRHLEVALVDVSGNGREAGTRALLLSGALGGLLGSVPPEEFLAAANAYLVRQRWAEGFATAAHVAVDLTLGAYSVGTAGHPAPAQYLAGSGTWRLVPSGGGPLLGVLPGAGFPRSCGVLGRGDALLVYSDGIIESRGHDLVEGVDRMLGAATAAMIDGGGGLAEAVSRAARSGAGDDRAALALLRA